MKIRHPLMQFGLLLIIMVILVSIGVLDTAATVDPSFDYRPAQESSINSGVITTRDGGIEQELTSQPWSLARMEDAKPYPLPNVKSLPDTISQVVRPSADPIYFPSEPPSTNKPGEITAGNSYNLSDLSITSYDYPAPYSRFENFDSYQSFPYSTIGVLFFSQRGTDYRCSAAVVGENALWTAGHCVHDGSGEPGGWSENVVFVPAYKDGNEPFGSWSYNNLVTSTAWFSSADLRFDFAGVILNPNGTQQTIQDAVGSLGFAYNLDPIQHWFNFGYPSNTPFNGNTMQICAGSFARHASGDNAPIPIGMGCDMTPGSSGGPWIVTFSGSTGNTNYVNGNNSFRYSGFGEELFSPYFGEAAWEIFDYISPAKPTPTPSATPTPTPSATPTLTETEPSTTPDPSPTTELPPSPPPGTVIPAQKVIYFPVMLANNSDLTGPELVQSQENPIQISWAYELLDIILGSKLLSEQE